MNAPREMQSSRAPPAGPKPEERVDAGSAQVVFINRYFEPDTSATSQILSDLVRRLARHGVQVRVLTSRQLYDDPNARLACRESIDGTQVHRLWTTRFGRRSLPGRAVDYLTFFLSVAWRLLLLIRRGDVVVAKTDPPLISIVAVCATRLRGAILVNWLQDVFPEVATELGASPLPRNIERLLRRLRDGSLCAARANVVLGARMRAKLLAWGVPEHSVHIIENWADGDLISPRPPGQSKLRRDLIPDNSFVVAYCGNLGRAHEFETLLGAAELLREEPGWEYLMVGGGVKMQELKKVVASRGLGGFRFLPYQPRAQLPDTLAAADAHLVCLLPALEGLIVPSKVYGILASGRPVVFVGAQDGELADLVRETGCGLAVTSGDSVSLANCLRALRASPQVLASMAQRARSVFLERYTADRGAEKWLSVLGRVAPRIAVKAEDSARAVATPGL